MKFLKYIFIALAGIIFIAACQKELDFEVDGNAHGTLKSDGSGDCLPSTINGIFEADSVLRNTNFLDIQVNLSATGAYDIKSDTINGYSFHGTGNLGVTGINTVRLYATGKPIAEGTDVFTIKFDNSSCKVDVIVIGAGTVPAVYTLAGAPGACSGALSNGIYTAGTALGIDNTVTITVNVTVPGTYNVGTTSANGMLFSSTGVFMNTGPQDVVLNGTGIPSTDGIFNITASNGTSDCSFSITVVSATGGAAVYSLDITSGACSGATYTGTFNEGSVLTSSNVVLLNANVTTIGTYTISTDTLNGISFLGSGTFTATGPQTLALTGSGTPIAAGIFNFTATVGTTSCTFSVTINSSAAVNQDYVPETAFSNWSDRFVGGTAADTTYIQVSPNTIIKNGLTYKIFEIKVAGVPADSTFNRKNGGQYYHLYNEDYGFDAPFNTDGLALDSSLAVNATWSVNLGNNTIGGAAATGKIDCKIIQKDAVATVAGNTYNNIIKVTYIFSYDTGSGYIAYATEEVWYAKGKGVIYDSISDIPMTYTDITETTRIQIF